MPRGVCACGAPYRLPEGTEGRKAKCRRCGRVFRVPGEPLPVAPADGETRGTREAGKAPAGVPGLESREDSACPVPPPPGASAYGLGWPAGMGSGDESPVTRRSFGRDLLWSLVLFLEPANLMMLLVIWVLHALLPVLSFAGCFGAIGQVIVYGWLSSYWFKVIHEAAGGEDDLPTLELAEGVIDDVVYPLLKYLAATLLAWAPGLAVLIGVSAVRNVDPEVLLMAPTGPVLLAFAVSLFVWPMVLLVVGIGGVGAAMRVDLLSITIARTLLPYLAICGLVGGAFAVQVYGDELLAWTSGGGRPNFWLACGLGGLLQAYTGIVSMRVVGLYYHHFKKRFAWSWG